MKILVSGALGNIGTILGNKLQKNKVEQQLNYIKKINFYLKKE